MMKQATKTTPSNTTSKSSHSPSSNQDWFLMTGDLIINLRSTKTGDVNNSLFLNNNNNKHKFHNKTTTILDDNQNQVSNSNVKNKHKNNIKNEHLSTASDDEEEDCLDGIGNRSNLEHQLDQAKETQIDGNQQLNHDETNDVKLHDNAASVTRNNTFTCSKISNSSSGNSSSGIAADVELELLSQSQSYSDCISSSVSSPTATSTKTTTPYSNCSSSDYHFYYDNDKSSPHTNSTATTNTPTTSTTTTNSPNTVLDHGKPPVPKTQIDQQQTSPQPPLQQQQREQQASPTENCYENIDNCKYLSKSEESNLYNLIDDHHTNHNIDSMDSKSIGSLDSDNSSLLYYSTSNTTKNNGNQRCIDTPSASRLARRLYNLEGFKKSDVARHLCKNNEFCRTVAEEYLKLFDFTNQQLDDALRHFLSFFHLIGETQERERVLVYFSKRYNQCNPDNRDFNSVDSIHTLTCALMLLNTDLHEESIQRKMTCSSFILNLSGMNDGQNYPANLLKYLYYSVKNHPLGWMLDDEESLMLSSSNKKDVHHQHRKVFSKITTISKSITSPYATLPRKFSTTSGAAAAIAAQAAGSSNMTMMANLPPQPATASASFCMSSNPFVEVPNPTFAIEYKKGYIRRKCCYDSNGRKTSLGKRSWKLFYATLRDLVLYLHKDENGFRKSQLQESFANSIRIHHSIASIANDYPKKKFVFRLITADYAEYLFETSDSKELQSWIDTINTTAASLSAPTLPMPVSSDNNRKFKKEIFPVSHTKLSLRDQLKDQENKLLSLQKELELLLEKSCRKSKFQKEFLEKETYLQHEIKRYRVYITCLKHELQKKISTNTEHLNQNIFDNDSANINNNNNRLSSNDLDHVQEDEDDEDQDSVSDFHLNNHHI